MAVRLAAERAVGRRWQINWHLAERDERICQTLSNETLTQIIGKSSASADASVATSRETLINLLVGKVTVEQAGTTGALRITGDAEKVGALFELLEGRSGRTHPHMYANLSTFPRLTRSVSVLRV